MRWFNPTALLVPATFAVACGPAHTHVERSATYTATVDDVYPHVADLKNFTAWSPWSKMDPNAKNEFSEKTSGEGAWYSWSGNDDVGTGKMTIVKEEKGKSVTHKLEFFEPWEGVSESGFQVAAKGDQVTVTWTFDQDNEGFGKVMAGFIDMDDMLGKEYEKGLATLEGVVAKSVAERVEREKKAAEEAAAKKAAEEAAAAEAGDGAEAPSAGG